MGSSSFGPCCICRYVSFFVLAVVAVVGGAIAYEHFTGKKAPIIGDKLPNATEVTDTIKNFDWPDFDFEDIIIFDEPPNVGNEGGGGIVGESDPGGDENNEENENGSGWGGWGGWGDLGDNNKGNDQTALIGWKTKETDGLSLSIQNALTEDWHPFFDQAIADWQSGDPNLLELETSVVDADPSCKPLDGIMKVCNDDFGATGWEGVNEVYSQGNAIVSSVAKMNEYYLGLEDTAIAELDAINEYFAGGTLSGASKNMANKRQYTMCHEIGHGFGLPHLDENFYNADLNSCMDYSSRPANNLKPNKDDYKVLFKLYGDKNTRWRRLQGRYLHSNNFILNGKLVRKEVFYFPVVGKRIMVI